MINIFLNIFQSKNIGVICAAAHGMGLFTNDGPQKWHPASNDLKLVCENASKYCKVIKLTCFIIFFKATDFCSNNILGRLGVQHSLGCTIHDVEFNTECGVLFTV